MPASSFLAMAQALADIETLKGIGRIAAHMGLTPTQEELSNAWMAAKNSTSVPEGATAVNLDQEAPLGHSWTALDVSGTLQWFDRGTDVVNTATNAAPGVVKGDGAGNGKVAVEADGSMAVNGWDENVSNVQLSNITADTADFGTDAADSVPALLLIIAKKIRGLFSFFTNGAANIAVRLQTARSFQTNLASTAAASFDGSANVTPGVTGILPIANGGTGRTDGRSYMPAGIIVFTASYNPDAQRLVPLDGQTLTNAYVAGNQYYNLAQCFPSTTGGFVKSGNNLTLPNYQGLFLRGSGSQSITEYGFSGTHNGGNIGEKHGDAIREIFGEIDNNVVYGGGIRGTGAMRQYGYSHGTADSGSGAGFGGDVFNFYVSRVVPTDSTNHPAFGVGKICITY
jgi:hypothetical protein